MTNLIAKPEHAALRDSLESRLRGLLQEAGDPCDTRVS